MAVPATVAMVFGSPEDSAARVPSGVPLLGLPSCFGVGAVSVPRGFGFAGAASVVVAGVVVLLLLPKRSKTEPMPERPPPRERYFVAAVARITGSLEYRLSPGQVL